MKSLEEDKDMIVNEISLVIQNRVPIKRPYDTAILLPIMLFLTFGPLFIHLLS